MATITLAPKGGFHVGEPVGIERQRVLGHIPADTLFAAFVTAWAERGQVAARLAPFLNGAPPLRLTSAFPCLYDEGPRATLRFFPRPLVRINADHDARERAGKRLKQAVWVSETLFWRLCRGDDVSDVCTDDCFAPGGVWITPQDRATWPLDAEGRPEPLWKQWNVPRVTLDRVTNASTLYHVGRLSLRENVGLWFAVRGDVSLIHSALDILADSGLGGLRSVGHGAFAWGESTDEDWEQSSADSGYVVTLSRYAPPNAKEIEAVLCAPRSAYRLESVGGWCVDDQQHAWRRRAVRMVAEGSVLGAGAVGHLVDVTPAKPGNWQDDVAPWPFGPSRRVYRWGYVFPVQIASAALPEEVGDA